MDKLQLCGREVNHIKTFTIELPKYLNTVASANIACRNWGWTR